MATDVLGDAFVEESIRWMHSVRTGFIVPSHGDLLEKEGKILEKVGVHTGLAIAFQDLRNDIKQPLPADSEIHNVAKLGDNLCRSRRGEKAESARQRAVNLMLPVCAAKWGLENTKHLEARSKSVSSPARLGTETIEKILSCARKYDWNQMRIILNHVLVERNKVVAQGENNRVKALREEKGRSVLASEWVDIIKYKEFELHSDVRSWEHENDLWSRNRDGSVIVGANTLKGIRGDDYHKFLLDCDPYGLIQPWDYRNGESATLTLLGGTISSAPCLEHGTGSFENMPLVLQDPRASTPPPTQMPTPDTRGPRNTLPGTLRTEEPVFDRNTESSSDAGPSSPANSSGEVTSVPDAPEAWREAPASDISSASTAVNGLFLSVDPEDNTSVRGDKPVDPPATIVTLRSILSSLPPSPSPSPSPFPLGGDGALLHLEPPDDSSANKALNYLDVDFCLELRTSLLGVLLSLRHGESSLTNDGRVVLVMSWTWEERESYRCKVRATWSQFALDSREPLPLMFNGDEFCRREEQLQPFPNGVFQLTRSRSTHASDKPFGSYIDRLSTLPQTQLKVDRVFSHVAVGESEKLEVAKFVPLVLKDSEPILTTLPPLSDPYPRWMRSKLLDRLLVDREDIMFSKACSDVAENLCSGFLGTTGAFSGARFDVLCDTVIDVQSGSLLALTLPMAGLETLWKDDGSWTPSPGTSCTVTIVEQASQLYIPMEHIYTLCALERSCWTLRLTFNTKTIVRSITELGRLADACLDIDSYLNSYVKDQLPSLAGRLRDEIETSTEDFRCSGCDRENALRVLERYSSACNDRPHKRPRV